MFEEKYYFQISFELCGQCDQIGRFLKVFGDKFANKSGPKKIGDYWAILKRSSYVKNCSGFYLSNFWKQLDNLLTPPSGHTEFVPFSFHRTSTILPFDFVFVSGTILNNLFRFKWIRMSCSHYNNNNDDNVINNDDDDDDDEDKIRWDASGSCFPPPPNNRNGSSHFKV